MAGTCKKICRGVMWFFVLILLAWWVGLFAGLLHCILAPCAACCECTGKVTEFLMKGIRLPYTVAFFMVGGKSCKQAVMFCVC